MTNLTLNLKKYPASGDLPFGFVVAIPEQGFFILEGDVQNFIGKRNRFDLIGKRFGRLTVISLVGVDKRGNRLWDCACDCGKKNEAVLGKILKEGRTKSCGCLREEAAKRANTTHGMSLSSEYSIWKSMIQRTTNKNASNYGLYGGRGITVCERWLKSFEAFYEDMGPRPDGMTLDRKDNDGNYEPDNCRWVTSVVQNRNCRLRSDNKTGCAGVEKLRNGRYLASINNDSGFISLGRYSTLPAAVEARKQGELKYWGKEI